MSRDKTIAVIGVSDEETAHLRLLMRKCAADLDHRWRWGDEKSADLLVVDPGSFAGQMARTRALSSGKRCAVFSDATVPEAELVMCRPLLTADVIRVLNQAAAADMASVVVGVNGEDFYTRDLGESASAAFSTRDARVRSGLATGLDEVLKPTPVELREPPRRATAGPRSPVPAAVERGGSAIERRTASDPAPASARAEGAPPRYATRSSMLADTAPHPLRAYLQGDLLLAPARIVLADFPALVLDPKQQVAHSAAGLSELGPYCDARWPLRDWQPLTTAELSRLRTTQPALPYARLLWLDVLMHSDGQLARHLDPAGTYRLLRWTEVDRGFGRYFRIASALMQPARLHEIASASGAPMNDVFDFVSACDAIGAIEWQPRSRNPDMRPSLLDKLRRPFG